MNIDLGRVTPIYRGAYNAAEHYELNDIVLSSGALYWHVSQDETVGVAPPDTTVWTLAFSGADVEAAIEQIKEDAEAIALGTRGGVPVSSDDPYYHNNAAWYSSQASASATAAGNAQTAAEAAQGKAEDAQTAAETAQGKAEDAQGKAEDAQAAAETAAEQAEQTLSTYAKTDGVYEDLTAGTALQLIGSSGNTDKAPYLFRRTPFAATRKEVKRIIGATVAWNQLVEHGNFDSPAGWSVGNASKATIAIANNECTLTVTETSSSRGDFKITRPSAQGASGHKYLQMCSIYAPKSIQMLISNGDGVVPTPFAVSANAWTRAWSITNASLATRSFNVLPNSAADMAVGDVLKFRDAVCFDLTQTLGSDIADHAYTLESGTAGAGIEWLRSYGFFTSDYYAHDAGTLQSVCVLESVTKDANDQTLGNYPLDSSTEWRGLYKLVDGAIVADGDEYPANGAGTRKYILVNLGDLTWRYSGGIFEATISGAKTADINAICSRYVRTYQTIAAMTDGEFRLSVGYYTPNVTSILIKDSAYSDKDTFKSAMSTLGVQLVISANTPEAVTAAPYAPIQICAGDGTEAYVDALEAAGTRDVAVPPGHETFYPTDLVAALQNLITAVSNIISMLAYTETGMTASRNYTAGEFVVAGGKFFMVTANIANGAALTPGTNVTETTVGAALTALA